jgi:hypothetical protein
MIRRWIWRNGAKIPIFSRVAAAFLSEYWTDFAHISFWLYFEVDIVAIKDEKIQELVLSKVLSRWYNTVFSLWRQKSNSARRCKRCGTYECHLLLSRLYWFDYSCWVSLVVIGKHKWLCRFVMRLSRASTIYIYHLIATHHRRSWHS